MFYLFPRLLVYTPLVHSSCSIYGHARTLVATTPRLHSGGVCLRKMTEQSNNHSPATTRKGVFQEISVLAGAVAVAGGALAGEPSDAAAAGLPTASTSAGIVTEEGTYVRTYENIRS